MRRALEARLQPRRRARRCRCRALAGSGPPARGGSRRSRPARRARRARPARARTARAGRRASPSAARRKRRRGSAGAGSGTPRRPAAFPCSAGSAPCARARAVAGARPTRDCSGASCMTAVWWKTSPSTEPRSITARSSSPSRSRRACNSAWIVGGTVSAPPPSSRTIATISSTNSGFPSADVRMRPRTSASRATPSSRLSRSSSTSPCGSGSSRIDVAFGLPPPHIGRASSSSGRATQSRKIAPLRDQSATCSTTSRNVSSAHWRSSRTTTSGCSAAALSSRRRNASCVSGGDEPRIASGSAPS